MACVGPVSATDRTPLLPLEAFFGNPKRPNPRLEGFTLAPAKQVRLKAGKRATLTLPLNAKPKSLPAVIDLQGEPRIAQWLANRGYAVLRVESQDLSDGVRWLAKKGIADPKRIAVFGVRKGESLRTAQALKSAGKIVDYIELPDEEPGNWLEFYVLADRFLAEHLGGRAGPEVWEK